MLIFINVRIFDDSIDFMGGIGFSCEYPQEKFFRDCKVGECKMEIDLKRKMIEEILVFRNYL